MAGASEVDEIRLTFPPEPPFYPLAHLVVGGVATRLDLSFESVEDLQIAIESLLERAPSGDDVTVSVRVQGDAIETRVGPFDSQALQQELEREEGGVGLRRILDTVADRVEVSAEEGRGWVALKKSKPTAL